MKIFGSDDWSWLNPPASWAETGAGLSVTTSPKTDFWRTTHYGFIRDTGHALGRRLTGEFTLTTTFSGAYADLYDHAGVLLRIDERNWIKTGIEYVGGEQLLSSVVTRDVSDWSVVSLPSPPGSVTLSVDRTGDTVTVHYGVDGAKPVTMARLAYFPAEPEVFAGVMCASPEGGGFKVDFTRLDLAQR